MSGSTMAFAIQYLLNEKEYTQLIQRLSANLRQKLPPPQTLNQHTHATQKYIRRHWRLLVKVWVALGVVKQFGRVRKSRESFGINSGKIAGSVTAISGLYKLAFLILSRIHGCDGGKRFLSGVVAGLGYSLFPKEAGRSAIGVYAAAKAVEYLYNYVDDAGCLKWKPRWIGSWAMFPLSMAQLFYTFIFHPDCCPSTFKRLMMRFSEGYIPAAPVGATQWPDPDQVVESIADISVMRYPSFNSPVLYPTAFQIDSRLSVIEPVVAMAHPAITTLTGALTHPHEPSELAALGQLIVKKFASASKYVFLGYAAAGLLRRRDIKALYPAIGNTVRTTMFLVMTAATCWGGINASQSILGRKMLPVYRYRLIGGAAGLWALLDMHSRARYLYAARLAVMSWWDLMVKQGKVKPWKHGDIAVFCLALGVIMELMGRNPGSVAGAGVRKSLNWVQTGEYADPVDLEKNDV